MPAFTTASPSLDRAQDAASDNVREDSHTKAKSTYGAAGRAMSGQASVDHSHDIAPFGPDVTNNRRMSAQTTMDHSHDIAPFDMDNRANVTKDRRISAQTTIDHAHDIAPFGVGVINHPPTHYRRTSAQTSVDHWNGISPLDYGLTDHRSNQPVDRTTSAQTSIDHSYDIAPFGTGIVSHPSDIGYRRTSAQSTVDHSNDIAPFDTRMPDQVPIHYRRTGAASNTISYLHQQVKNNHSYTYRPNDFMSHRLSIPSTPEHESNSTPFYNETTVRHPSIHRVMGGATEAVASSTTMDNADDINTEDPYRSRYSVGLTPIRFKRQSVQSGSSESGETPDQVFQIKGKEGRSTWVTEEYQGRRVAAHPNFHLMVRQLTAPSSLDRVADVSTQGSNRFDMQSMQSEAEEMPATDFGAHSQIGRIMPGTQETPHTTVDSAERHTVRRLSAPSSLDHTEDTTFFYDGMDNQYSSTRRSNVQEGLESSPSSVDYAHEVDSLREMDHRSRSRNTPEPRSNRASVLPTLDSVREATSLDLGTDGGRAGVLYNDASKPVRVSIGSIRSMPSSLADEPDSELIYASGDRPGLSASQVKAAPHISESARPALSELDHAETMAPHQSRRVHRAHSAEEIEGGSDAVDHCVKQPSHARGFSVGSIHEAPTEPTLPKPTTSPNNGSEKRFSVPVPIEEPNITRRRSTASARSAPSELGHAQPSEFVRDVGADRHVAFNPPESEKRQSNPIPITSTTISGTSKFIINTIIIVAYVSGALIAAGHHFFLTALNNRDVGDYSQFWIKNASNTFAQVVVIVLGLTVTLSITEGVWKVVKSETMSEEVTSDLFTLPATASILACMRRRWKLTIVPLIFLALIYQLLAFVSMFAPNALSIGPMEITQDIPVPQLSFSTALTDEGNAAWFSLVDLMLISPADNWDVPALCGGACSFELEYQAPGLSCRDLRQDEIALKHYDPALLTGSGWTFYEAPYQFQLPLTWGHDDFNLSLSYISMSAQVLGLIPSSVVEVQDIGGNFCRFEDKTYQARFVYAQGDRFVSTEVVTDQSQVDQQCNWTGSSLSTDCQQYGSNVASLISGFTSPFFGSLTWRSSGIDNNITGPYELGQVINFTNDTASGTVSLNTRAANTSQTLEDLFANITLGALLSFNHTEIKSVTIQQGNAWVYDRYILWALYAPALVLVLLCACYGVYCSINDEDAMHRSFSNVLPALSVVHSTVMRNGQDAWNRSFASGSATGQDQRSNVNNSRGLGAENSSGNVSRPSLAQQSTYGFGLSSTRGRDDATAHGAGTTAESNPTYPQVNTFPGSSVNLLRDAQPGSPGRKGDNANTSQQRSLDTFGTAGSNQLNTPGGPKTNMAANGLKNTRGTEANAGSYQDDANDHGFFGSLGTSVAQQSNAAFNSGATSFNFAGLGPVSSRQPGPGIAGALDAGQGDTHSNQAGATNHNFFGSFGASLVGQANDALSPETTNSDTPRGTVANSTQFNPGFGSNGVQGDGRDTTVTTQGKATQVPDGTAQGFFSSVSGSRAGQASTTFAPGTTTDVAGSTQLNSAVRSANGAQGNGRDTLVSGQGNAVQSYNSTAKGLFGSFGAILTGRLNTTGFSDATSNATTGDTIARSNHSNSASNPITGSQGGNFNESYSNQGNAMSTHDTAVNGDFLSDFGINTTGSQHAASIRDATVGASDRLNQANASSSSTSATVRGGTDGIRDSQAGAFSSRGAATEHESLDRSGSIYGQQVNENSSRGPVGSAHDIATGNGSSDAVSAKHANLASTASSRGTGAAGNGGSGSGNFSHQADTAAGQDANLGAKFWASLGFTQPIQPRSVYSQNTSATRNFSDDSIVVRTKQSDGAYSRSAFMDRNFSDSSFATHTNQSNTLYTQSNDALIESKDRNGKSKGQYGNTREGSQGNNGRGRQNQNTRKNGKVTMKQRIMTLSTEIFMILLLIMSLILALGHHAFLSRINGRPTGSTDNQFWIRNAGNAFSHVIVICLGTATNIALTQACWRAIKLMGLRIKMIDNMFSLPSPKAIMALLRGIRAKHAFYLVGIELIMQGLILVSILAPNALTVGFTRPGPVQLGVPVLDLSTPLYDGLIEQWDDLIDQMIVNVPSNVWSVPSGCGSNCSFEVVYQAPALSCSDLPPSEYSLTLFDPNNLVTEPNTTTTGVQWAFYDSHSSLIQDETQWNGYNDTSFICNYKPMVLSESSTSTISVNYTSPHAGSTCYCHDGTYRTKFSFANNQKTVETTLLSNDNGFSGNCTWSDASNLSPKCKNYATNSLQICKAFRNSFSGIVEWYINKTRSTVERQQVLDKIVDINANLAGNEFASLTPRFANLSEGLVELFSNMTSNLLPELNNSTTADVHSLEGVSIWVYSATILWCIYGPGIFLVLAIIIYGFYCIYRNGMVLDRKVSTLIMVAKSEGLLDDTDDPTSDQGSKNGGYDTTGKGGYYELSDLHLPDRIRA